MLIPVCQYMRPNGVKSWAEVNIDDSLKEKYEQLVSVNGFLSAEILTTGEVVIYLEQKPDGYEIYMKIVQNGPEILDVINELFKEFSIEEWNRRLKEFEE
jgi:hypothetical protein